MALSNTRETVERSLFTAIINQAYLAGYNQNVQSLTNSNITAISLSPYKFTIAGNLTTLYTFGRTFTVIGSTLNNGTYTVSSSALVGGNTVITTSTIIPSVTVDGQVSILTYYNDVAGVAAFQAAYAAIVATNGFAVDVFGVGSEYSKYQKKVPRIVIVANQTLPGALGGDSSPIYIPIGTDPDAPTSYTKEVLPPQTLDYTYDIRLVHSTAQQGRVLCGILALALPTRGYIDIYNDVNNVIKIYVEQYSFRNIPDPSQNVEESIYMYKVGDVYEQDNTTLSTTIAPITQITLDTFEGDAPPGGSTPFGGDLVIT